MNARINGKTRAPKGMIIINDSHGDSPAFLHINQNGKTPTNAIIMPTMKIMISSGIPIGPIIFFVVWFLDGLKFFVER